MDVEDLADFGDLDVGARCPATPARDPPGCPYYNIVAAGYATGDAEQVTILRRGASPPGTVNQGDDQCFRHR